MIIIVVVIMIMIIMMIIVSMIMIMLIMIIIIIIIIISSSSCCSCSSSSSSFDSPNLKLRVTPSEMTSRQLSQTPVAACLACFHLGCFLMSQISGSQAKRCQHKRCNDDSSASMSVPISSDLSLHDVQDAFHRSLQRDPTRRIRPKDHPEKSPSSHLKVLFCSCVLSLESVVCHLKVLLIT